MMWSLNDMELVCSVDNLQRGNPTTKPNQEVDSFFPWAVHISFVFRTWWESKNEYQWDVRQRLCLCLRRVIGGAPCVSGTQLENILCIHTCRISNWLRTLWSATESSMVRKTRTDTHMSFEQEAWLTFLRPNPLSAVVTDLRIPLMWKDTEYFKNKGGEAPPLLLAFNDGLFMICACKTL